MNHIPLPETLHGSIASATGAISWTTRLTFTGRAWVTITAVAPTGQRVLLSVRFADAWDAENLLAGTIEHFQRSTLAQWEEAHTKVRMLIVLTPTWDLTVGRHGTDHPQVRMLRRERARVRGWDRCFLRTRRAVRGFAPDAPTWHSV